MPSFEEDAFARAQQMHRRMPQNHNHTNKIQSNATTQKQQEPPAAEPKDYSVNPTETTEQIAPLQNGSFLNSLFKDKDQSIILLLIVLLMEENSNPTLLLALIYLLI